MEWIKEDKVDLDTVGRETDQKKQEYMMLPIAKQVYMRLPKATGGTIVLLSLV